MLTTNTLECIVCVGNFDKIHSLTTGAYCARFVSLKGSCSENLNLLKTQF